MYDFPESLVRNRREKPTKIAINTCQEQAAADSEEKNKSISCTFFPVQIKMPLASSRSSTAKAGESRRQSLPKTIDSSTKMTRSKAMKRRASLSKQRKTNETVVDKENQGSNTMNTSRSPGPTPYWQVLQERGGKVSPRQTRSATKKRRTFSRLPPAPAIQPNGGGVVLNFSPPDQRKNQEMERLNLERREREREERLAKKRESQLLLLSSMDEENADASNTNESNVMENEAEMQSEQNCLNLSAASSNITMEEDSSKSSSVDNDQVLKELSGFKETMNDALAEFLKVKANNEQSANEFAQSKVHEVELEAQKTRCEELSQSNAKLEENTKIIQSELKTLECKFATAKETHLCEKTRLESEFHASKCESTAVIKGLEESKAKLEEQNTALQVEVKDLQMSITAAQGKLKDAQSQLDVMRAGSEQGKTKLIAEMDSLVQSNRKLISDLDSANKQKAAMEKQLADCEEAMDTLENQLLPESEAQLKQALKELQVQKETAKLTEKTLFDSQNTIESLQSEVEAMKESFDKERKQLEESVTLASKAYDTLKNDDGSKRRKVGILTEELTEVKSELSQEKKRSQQAVEESLRIKNQLESQLNEMQAVMKDMEAKLKSSEQATHDLESKYSDALEQIKAASQAKEEAMANCSTTTASLEKLNDDLTLEKDRIKKLEEELRNRQLRITELDQSLQETTIQRDDAESRMESFDERENELFRKLQESDRIRRNLHNRVMQLSGNIRVYVRVRPTIKGEIDQLGAAAQNKKDSKSKKRKHDETNAGEQLFRFPGVYDREEKVGNSSKTSTDDLTKNLIEVKEPYKDRGGLKQRQKKWKFGFDNVFSPSHGQDDIWEATEPLVQSAIDGYNVCIFAYGQTGSGKTYTMLGESSNEGIIGRSVRKLFDTKAELEALSRGETKVALSVELLEIYNDNVRDLLVPKSGPNGKEINLKLSSKEAVGNRVLPAKSVEDVMNVLDMAQKRRCVKATMSNAESSRSHMIFTIHFKVKKKDGVTQAGKLHVCDLAGSERLDKSGATGSLLTETKHINSSLSVLSNVIEKLQNGDKVIPYRESKLTFLLQNSLGGNSKTLAIVCCNPLNSHFHESLSSLRFAAKVNKVDLKAVANFSC